MTHTAPVCMSRARARSEADLEGLQVPADIRPGQQLVIKQVTGADKAMLTQLAVHEEEVLKSLSDKAYVPTCYGLYDSTETGSERCTLLWQPCDWVRHQQLSSTRSIASRCLEQVLPGMLAAALHVLHWCAPMHLECTCACTPLPSLGRVQAMPPEHQECSFH